MSMIEGYSGTPLPKKLGLKDGQSILYVRLPKTQSALQQAANFSRLICADGPKATDFSKPFDMVHIFTRSQRELENELASLKAQIYENGVIWVSWPKKSSGVPSDLDENIIRGLALKNGLVDIKVCAVDATWSGLKLVIPVKQRSHKLNS